MVAIIMEQDSEHESSLGPQPRGGSDGGWTDDLEFYIFRWRRFLFENSLSHQQAAENLLFKNSCVKIPLLVFSSLAGSLGLLEVSSGPSSEPASSSESAQYEPDYHSLTLASGGLAMVVAILTALQNSLNLEKRATAHLFTSRQLARLAVSVEVTLIQPRGKRENSTSVIDRLLWGFQNVLESAPNLSGAAPLPDSPGMMEEP